MGHLDNRGPPGRSLLPPPVRDATVAVDEKARIIEWNDAAELLLGFRRPEVLGQSATDILSWPERRAELVARFERLKRGVGEPRLGQPYPTSLRHRDGSEIRVIARVVRTDTEPPNLVVSLRGLEPDQRDDAERRHLRTILDSSEDAMAILSPDGLVRAWNPAAEELYGFDAEEAMGQRLSSLIVPGDLMHEPRSWLAAMMRGESVELETRRLRKDRSEVRVFVRMLPVRDAFETPIGSVMIARDVTDREALDERRRAEAEEELWRARIDASLVERGGFALAAQPVVDLRTGDVRHHELLLRMRVDGRLALPSEFVERAERSGQIREIDLWVTRAGLGFAERFPISINISIRSLAGTALFAVIDQRLAEGALDPGEITFEITETATAADLEKAVLFARRLKELGCGVSLDDFGTGFGCFTYLDRFPASELKIDRRFVGGLPGDEGKRRVVETIIAVARNFGLRTVAEGVETTEAAEFLADRGVDLGQGHLFGRPRLLDLWRMESGRC